MEVALATSGVAIPIAGEGTIRVNSGQARLSDAAVRAQGADLAISGNVTLAEGDLDAPDHVRSRRRDRRPCAPTW